MKESTRTKKRKESAKPKAFSFKVDTIIDDQRILLFGPRSASYGDTAIATVHDVFYSVQVNGKHLRYEPCTIEVTFEPVR